MCAIFHNFRNFPHFPQIFAIFRNFCRNFRGSILKDINFLLDVSNEKLIQTGFCQWISFRILPVFVSFLKKSASIFCEKLAKTCETSRKCINIGFWVTFKHLSRLWPAQAGSGRLTYFSCLKWGSGSGQLWPA